jgi:phosphopantothenoylcysteine synthetase/decarboxylase
LADDLLSTLILSFTGPVLMAPAMNCEMWEKPAVQRNVIVSAQIALARHGLYREQIDGIYGPSMELSLRAYQSRTRLPVTGRLDLETLAALRLLPGPRQPFYDPYRRRRMRRPPGPPIEGQWVPD